MASDWTTGLNDDLKNYVTTKGFKGIDTVIDSYRNFEKLQGMPQDRILKLPEKSDDPNWNNVYDRLGKPKEAKDYQVEVPKEYGDPDFAEWSKKLFHENNLTRAQGESIAKKWNEYVGNKRQADIQMRQDNIAKQETTLKKDWGAAYEQNSRVADRAVQLFGDKAASVLKAVGDAVGMAEGMKILHALGTKLGEDSFVSSDTRSNGFGDRAYSPSEARAEIGRLRQDQDFLRRYLSGGREEVEKMNRLHEYLVS